MLQIVASNTRPIRRATPREAEMESITAHICKICHSFDALPPRDSADRESLRQIRVKDMLQMIRPDWPDNPSVMPKLTYNEWTIAVTNGVDRRA